jgi:formate dehydrogenase subunit delta
MQADRLVEMANQIADYFRADPDRQAAIAAAAGHLRRFWDPRMRTQIIAHYNASGEGLNEIARQAVGLLASGRQ